MRLRTGYTTGACAAAATRGAVCLLTGHPVGSVSHVFAPSGAVLTIPVSDYGKTESGAFASVIKDAGEERDITHGARVTVTLEPQDCGGIQFRAGTGVGVVTRQGLSVPPGEPAINPGPRAMIRRVLQNASIHHVIVTIAIENGAALARHTYNPRLGVEGGLSVLGTTGIVRPRCTAALKRTIELSLSVAYAESPERVYMVPGNIGATAARKYFQAAWYQIVEVENHWGFAIGAIPRRQGGTIDVVGHPGKLIKLARGEWYTHSKFSAPVAETLAAVAQKFGLAVPAVPNTTQEVLDALTAKDRWTVCRYWCDKIQDAVKNRLGQMFCCDGRDLFVTLITMTGEIAASNSPSLSGRCP
jgi:cobalt-precorrin-5B (C1)-methyltransferase